MALKRIGNLVAFLAKADTGAEKNQYVRIGTAFRDTGDPERIALKIDSLPLNKAWQGWCNVFADEAPNEKAGGERRSPGISDDDIPF